MKKLFKNFLLFIALLISISAHVYAGNTLQEMITEAELAGDDDTRMIGSIHPTKELFIEHLINLRPSPKPSIAYEPFKSEALQMIKRHTCFFKDMESVAPWSTIAYIALGTSELREKLSCLVALADFRDLPKFRAFLGQLIKDVDFSVEEDAMEILSKRFSSLRMQ